MSFSTRRIAFCFACVCISHFSVVASAELPTIKELSDGIDRRHAAYGNLKLVYDVQYRTESSPRTPPALDTNGRFVSASDVFKFVRTASTESPNKWNSSWILPRSYGGKRAFENPFQDILFLRLNVISNLCFNPDLPVAEEARHHLMDKLVVERERVVAGQTIYSLKGLLDSADESDWFEIDVSGAPDYLIYRVEVFHQKQSVEIYRVDQYSKLGSIAYPSQGFFQQSPIGTFFGFTYQFNVTYAGSLSAEDRTAWIPKWPPNTLVQNPTVQSPLEARQYVTQRETALGSMSPSPRRAIFLVLGCLVTFAVAMGLWFSWSTGSFESRLLFLLVGLGVPSALLAYYLDQDLAASFLHIGGFVAMTVLAGALRWNNWRIRSDRRLSRNHRFSTREIGLWTASLAVFIALAQLLTKSDLGG